MTLKCLERLTKSIQITYIIICMLFVVSIISLGNTVYAKYIINKNFVISSNSVPFFLNASYSSESIEQKNNEANLTIYLNNYASNGTYNTFDTKYNIQVTSDKYNITITDSNNGNLAGGAKKTNSINVKFVPKNSSNLTLEETAKIVITSASPYKKTITKSNLIIKNSDILYNVGVVTGGYDTSINSTGVAGWKDLAADNFFLDLTKVEIPGDALGTMNFSKEYDATNGILNIHRTSIQGPGFIIQFTANIYASFQPVFVGNVTGDYTATIDCTGVTDWKSRTVDDFIIDIKWMDLPAEITGTCYITKSYNASTGILTIKRSSLQGNGTVTFNADVYTTRFPSQVTNLNGSSVIQTTSNEGDLTTLSINGIDNSTVAELKQEEIEIENTSENLMNVEE